MRARPMSRESGSCRSRSGEVLDVMRDFAFRGGSGKTVFGILADFAARGWAASGQAAPARGPEGRLPAWFAERVTEFGTSMFGALRPSPVV